MRIVVYPHSMEYGGSQLNAVDLSTALRDRGHDVVVFAPPGALVDRVTSLGLRHEPAPRPRLRPSPAVMNRLCAVAGEFNADIVHGFEWPPALEAVFGPERRLGIPAVCTVMSMSVAPFLPRWLPLTVGTRQILHEVIADRPATVLLEPPVDTEHDQPADRDSAKQRLGIDPDTPVVTLVTRLAPELKLEGILAAIAAVGVLAADRPVRLVIAGDGPARADVAAAAARVNAGATTPIVLLTGALADPRPVYDAADVALGMGGSALRSMAFGKPVIVQGERGYWRLLEPDSLAEFLDQGWFGIGDSTDPRAGEATLLGILRPLLADPSRRAELGDFARHTVESRNGLPAAAERLERFYADTIRRAGGTSPARFVRPYLAATRYDLTRKIRRHLGGVPGDDFNTLPAVRGPAERAIP